MKKPRAHLLLMFLLLNSQISAAQEYEPLIIINGSQLLAAQHFKNMALQIKEFCIRKFPESRQDMEHSYASWPLGEEDISVRLNGKDFVDLENEKSISSLLGLLAKDDEQAMQSCSKYRSFLVQTNNDLRNIGKFKFGQ